MGVTDWMNPARAELNSQVDSARAAAEGPGLTNRQLAQRERQGTDKYNREFVQPLTTAINRQGMGGANGTYAGMASAASTGAAQAGATALSQGQELSEQLRAQKQAEYTAALTAKADNTAQNWSNVAAAGGALFNAGVGLKKAKIIAQGKVKPPPEYPE